MKQKTVANVQLAASMSTAIALACDEVVMAKNGRWLVHNPWTKIAGDAAKLEKQAVDLRNMENQFAQFYFDRCDGDKCLQDFVDLMNEERWMTADEAFEWGFVDVVEDVFNISAFATLNKMMAKATKPLPDDFLNQNEDETMTKAEKLVAEAKAAEEEAKATEEAEAKEEADAKATEEADAKATEEAEAKAKEEADAKATEEAEVKAAEEEAKAKEEADAKAAAEEEGGEVTSAMKAMIESKVALDYMDKISGYVAEIAEKTEKLAKLSAEVDSLRAENATFEENFSTVNSRLQKFTQTALTAGGEVTTWSEALAACGDDYVVARRKYADVYSAFMAQTK
jgi:chemotaxis protein histidine kinase CheA